MTVDLEPANSLQAASMDASDAEGAWTATQVRVLAVTGLVSSHLQPLVRLLHNDPKRRAKGDTRSRILVLESRDDVVCRRQRERDGKYTATWSSTLDDEFNILAGVDWVELQVWNRFANGFDVFLGKETMSLHRLRQQCAAGASAGGSGSGSPPEATTTGALWFPLEASKENGLSSQLSLQIACRFTYDRNMLCIHEQIHQRQTRKTSTLKRRKAKRPHEEPEASDPAASASDDDDGGDPSTQTSPKAKSVVDPTFAFTQPFLPIEWSSVASTSLRHLFFHSDVECLMDFREFILYGDVTREMEEDEGLQIHDDHRAAFKVCQFSAQYLDHCVESLSERLQEYSAQYRVLADTRTHLARKRRGLKAQRRRLQKEHDDLDLLVTTYQRVLEKNGGGGVPEVVGGPQTEKAQELGTSLPTSPLGSPTASLPSKKPVFLKTWEERERERRLEKELSKAQRIEEERQRLRQRVLERQEREDHEALVTRLVERRRQRAAKRIQAFFRTTTQHLKATRFAAINRGATSIQAVWRCFISVKQYPLQLEMHKQARERKFMAENEREMRQWLAYQQQQEKEAWTQKTDLLQLSQDSEPEQTACASSTSSPSKHVVDALVATWRKLHRVFVLAHTANGIDYCSLFSQLDLRKDDVLDRAELRLGVRSFGVRLDRKLTRALITLIRTKCGAPSKPLLITFAQFMEGFELTSKETTLVDNRSTSEPKPAHDVEDNSHESRAPEAVHSDMPADTGVAQEHDESSEEEALVLAMRTFREAIHQAATNHLKALGKSTTDYRAFREALTYVFQAFDIDNDGQLDLDELVACMASFGLQVSKENTSLIQQLFSDGQSSDAISVTEFISFVLAHSSSTAEHHEGNDELGLQGCRMREAILTRVKQAQTQGDSVEAAVRFVLRAAYKRKSQQHCSIRDFVRALGSLHLGLAPTQIARLVICLDRDGDRSISFDELLVWLRLRPNVRSPPPRYALLSDSLRSSTSHAALLLAKAKAKVLRFVLSKIAEGDQPDDPVITPALAPANKKDRLTALFRRIDRNDSSQVNQDELQTFLATQDLAKIRVMSAETAEEEVLAELFGPSSLPQVPVARVAKEMMSFLDLNGNGVATLEEWLAFAQHDDMERGGDPAVIEAVRAALKASESQDPERLLLWFSGLPGAMQVASSNPREPTQMKVRVGEFKTALRLKLGGARLIPLRTIDQVVQSLDIDGSGWITINELHMWAFPSRDLEEILRLVIKSWEEERQKLLQQGSIEAFATSIYHRFDTDGNGCLAVRELLSGFAAFGVVLTEYEARVLMLAFDVDGDGCWNKTEFMAFVNKLFPAEPFTNRAPTATAPDRHEIHTSNDENHAPERDGHSSNHDEYDDDDLLLLSGSAESSLLSSNASATPMRENESELGFRPVKYSEDFDLDE